MSKKQNSILRAAIELRRLHEAGALGGERMPEDANPGLPRDFAGASYTHHEISGVLRTLNASRLIWNEFGSPSDRGYLDFLSRTIGPDPFRVIELFGLDEGVQETNNSP